MFDMDSSVQHCRPELYSDVLWLSHLQDDSRSAAALTSTRLSADFIHFETQDIKRR